MQRPDVYRENTARNQWFEDSPESLQTAEENCGDTTRSYLNLPGSEDELLSFRYVKRWVGSGPILDLGCSTGAYLRYFPADSIGLDASKPNLERCRQLGLTARFCDLNRELPFRSNTTPVIFCSHLLEHVDSPIALLRECYRVLSADGVLILGLPIENSAVNWLRGENYFRDHPGHLYSFSLTGISALLEKTGFELRQLYFEPRIIRNWLWLSALQHLPNYLAARLAMAYWVIANRS
jgi:SAM-dependent methyltransferase